MPAILLAITGAGWDPAEWQARFSALAPRRDLRIWPDRVGDPAAIAYACVWKPPAGLLERFSNLKAIFSLGAGVDHLIGDPDMPAVPIVRIVDRDLTARMTEYVVLHVLLHHRRLPVYRAQQRQRIWHEHAQPAASEVAVGILGLGVLGRDAAEVLGRIGFRVAGWSRTAKQISGIETFHGEAQLDAFLARTEILVCLLPHEPLSTSLNLNVLAPCAEALEPRTSAQTPIASQTAPRAKRGRASNTGTGNIEYLLSVDFDAPASIEVVPDDQGQSSRPDREVQVTPAGRCVRPARARQEHPRADRAVRARLAARPRRRPHRGLLTDTAGVAGLLGFRGTCAAGPRVTSRSPAICGR